MNEVERKDLIITQHALERFSERIMGYTEQAQINKYISENKNTIEERLNKMYKYSTYIYFGKIKKYEQSHIFVKDNWVLIVDKNLEKAITVYQLDLGLGEDFNKEFVNKVVDKIQHLQKEHDDYQAKAEAENKEYRETIEYNKNEIKQYNSYIDSLNKTNEALNTLINNNHIKPKAKRDEILKMVTMLVSKDIGGLS